MEGFSARTADGQRRVDEKGHRFIDEGGEVSREQDASLLAEMVVGMLNAPVAHWLSNPDYPIEERLPQAGAFAWQAIRRRPDAP